MGKFLNRNERTNLFNQNENSNFNSHNDNNDFLTDIDDFNPAFEDFGSFEEGESESLSENLMEELPESFDDKLEENPFESNMENNNTDEQLKLESNIMDDNIEKQNPYMKILNVNDIVVSADNPFVQRDGDGNNIDDIVSLANDIKENGLIHPITVTPNKDGKYELVSGERRLNALLFLKRTEVPAYIRSFKNKEEKDLAVFAANFATRQYSPLKRLQLIADYYRHLLLAYKKDVNASATARKKIADLLKIGNTQIQKYITIAKKINTIPPEVLSDFDNKIISLNELYKIVTNSNKQEKVSKNTNINEDTDNNTESNVNVVSEKEHLLNNSEEDNVVADNNPSEENVQDYENEKEDSSTSDFTKSENDIVEDNNANAEISLMESEEDSLEKHNAENEKKSEKEHCVELLGKLCIAGKKSNPKNLIAGYPVVINGRYFLVPKNIGIDCIDEEKDKYRVNMYDIEPSTLKVLQ